MVTDFHSLCKRRQTRAASSFSQKYSLLQAFVGKQLPEKYKEFECRNSPHIFRVVASLLTKKKFYWHYPDSLRLYNKKLYFTSGIYQRLRRLTTRRRKSWFILKDGTLGMMSGSRLIVRKYELCPKRNWSLQVKPKNLRYYQNCRRFILLEKMCRAFLSKHSGI